MIVVSLCALGLVKKGNQINGRNREKKEVHSCLFLMAEEVVVDFKVACCVGVNLLEGNINF